jgi:tellurite resistance protein TerA
MRLKPGQKTPLSALGIATRLTIDVDYGLDGLDVVLFGLDGSKRISDDRYTVLFSNTSTPEGAIRLKSASMSTGFDVDLSALPSSVERLMIVASHDTQPLTAARPLVVTIGEASFDAGSVVGAERALMLVEIYRHAGEWRLAAVGQGFAEGLGKLIEHLGGSVSDTPEQTPARQNAAPAPSAAPVADKSTPGVSLAKITLEKQKSVSLEKRGSTFGDIVLNLNWAQKRSGGFFGGGGATLDLDLGCLYEMRNGDKGVIQALGNAFGDYHTAPFMELDGDDRSGSNTAGETIRINGARFDQIKRIAVFALIYDGAVRWDQTDARASIRMPDQPEVVVEIRDGNDRQRLYGMAIVENDNGTMRITNHARCYRDQKEFAEAVGIHLRWVAGTKD